VSYYQGDYYQGDLWGRIRKGARKLGRAVKQVARVAAPFAGALLPAVGAATLIGRTAALAGRAKAAGRAARSVGLTIGGKTPMQVVSQLTGQNVGMLAPEPTPPKISAASGTIKRIRRAKAKRNYTRRKTRRAAPRRYRKSR